MVEYNGITEITNSPAPTVAICGTPPAIAPTLVSLPEATDGYLERYEGMLVTFPQMLTASQNYFQGRYGQVTLSSDGRMYNPTNGSGLGDTVALNARRMIVLDDGTSIQNPNPTPYIGLDNTLRAGDTVTGLTGVIDYGLITADTTTRDYRVQPTAPVSFDRVNARTGTPDSVGDTGTIKVASFNVLNYFTSWGCGDACRGANHATEFDRQRTKIIKALAAINADVVGLMEIENNGATAVGDLVAGLNAEIGGTPYTYVVEPAPGTDGIKVAMIYKPGTVTPADAAQNYQTSAGAYNPLFDRPPLAQTFTVLGTGEKFTVVVNHFKSKSSCPTSGVVDLDTGQGCWNDKRVAQATGLLGFIATLQATDPDVLVIGDLNAYGAEDPINTLVAGGLINEVGKIPAAQRYSYVFDGQAGYLDQGLATPSLDAQVSGRTIWHINADEPFVIDYNTEFKGTSTYPPDLYTPTPYRASDHDPVIVGLNLFSADYGDLAGYGGASHSGSGPLKLGSLKSIDVTPPAAGGDDASDDGVVRVADFSWQPGDPGNDPLKGGKVTITVNGGAGYVTGWIDWNHSGAFDDPAERIFLNEAFTAGATRTISFAIPDTAPIAGGSNSTFNARFRVYPTAQTALALAAGAAPDAVNTAPSPTGNAIGGEVEDYAWSFGPNAVTLRTFGATGAFPAWPAVAGFGLLGGAALTRRRCR